jgi:putative ABC transport system substrate-binding protein
MPDVILVNSTAALVTLAHETQTIPIVAQAADPVAAGLAAGLGRPGSNITGFTTFELTIGGKWLQLLKQIAPAVVSVLFIHSRGDTTLLGYAQAADSVAQSIGLKLTTINVGNAAEIEEAIDSFAREPRGGLVVEPSTINAVNRELIVALADKRHLPAVYPYRYYCTTGARRRTLIAFCAARSPQTSRFNNRPNSNWLSISGPPRRWASTCHHNCSSSPMRSSNRPQF